MMVIADIHSTEQEARPHGCNSCSSAAHAKSGTQARATLLLEDNMHMR